MGERDDWQPIETAPKDGTTVLLGHAHAVFDGWWSLALGAWVDGATNHHDEPFTYHPTHWMPLPSPPPRSGASLPDDGGA